MKKDISIVLSGSGTLFPLHAGALCAVEDAGYTIKEITGVSGGALVGALWAAGYRGRDLRKVLCDNPLTWKFWDLSLWPWRSLGLLKGRKIERLIGKIIGPVQKFKDVKDLHLNIVTACLDFQADPLEPRPTYWTQKNSPDQSISRAVRASMSLPGIFTPVSMSDGLRHVDGGVLNNFPIDDLYPPDHPTKVLGIRILSNMSNVDERPKSLSLYADRILDFFVHKGKEKPSSHQVITLEWQGSSFSPSIDSNFIRASFEVGYYQAMTALTAHLPEEERPIAIPPW
jgi:NTE family protein